MTSTLHLKSVAWIVMKVLKEKDKEGLSLKKKHGTKKWSEPRFISSIMQTAPWKHIFGSRSFICASKHLRSTPSDMFRVAYSWDARLFIRTFFLARPSSFIAPQMVGNGSSEWKQLLLCRPLGGETFKKSPSSSVATTEIVLWITSITLTLK